MKRNVVLDAFCLLVVWLYDDVYMGWRRRRFTEAQLECDRNDRGRWEAQGREMREREEAQGGPSR